MWESELEYSDRPEAFEGDSTVESSSSELQSSYFKGTDNEMLKEIEVPTEAWGTSDLVVGLDVDQPSTSGCGTEVVEVSITVSGEGVLLVVRGKQRVLMVRPKEVAFGMDFLKPNTFT